MLLEQSDPVGDRGFAACRHRLGQVADRQLFGGQARQHAPERDRSGASNSLTLDAPIRAVRLDDAIESINLAIRDIRIGQQVTTIARVAGSASHHLGFDWP